MTVIDSHIHLMRPGRADDIMVLRRKPEIRRDWLPADARAVFDANGVDQAVVIQASPTLDETLFLLELTWDAPWVVGVVGWVDLEFPGLDATLAALKRWPKFRGVRAMLHRIDDPEWIARDSVARGMAALAEADLALDFVALPAHLEPIRRALRRAPNLRAIVDHGATPPIGGEREPWWSGIEALARDTRAYCKLSGLFTPADGPADAATLLPFVSRLAQCFGPDRLLYGSDWPVVNTVGDYARWRLRVLELYERLGLDEAARMAIDAGTARRAYALAS
jgi:L-fuconolactonase